MSHFVKRLIGAALALLALAFAGNASAVDTIELTYQVKTIGISYDYRGMGYSDADGNFINLAGHSILSSTVKLDFTPDAGVDWSTLHMSMVVPVSGAASQYFLVEASDLVETRPGTFSYSLTTDLFNGVIYDGGFSIDTYGMNSNGDPVKLAGTVSRRSGFYYTVSASVVPEPATAALLLGGLMLVPVVARRRRNG